MTIRTIGHGGAEQHPPITFEGLRTEGVLRSMSNRQLNEAQWPCSPSVSTQFSSYADTVLSISRDYLGLTVGPEQEAA
jgi:hypothetical protein